MILRQPKKPHDYTGKQRHLYAVQFVTLYSILLFIVATILTMRGQESSGLQEAEPSEEAVAKIMNIYFFNTRSFITKLLFPIVCDIDLG